MTHTSKNLFRLPVLLAVASSIALCQGSPIVASGTSCETFSYKSIENIDVHADVYRLQGNNLRPVILWLHGGRLIFGNREALPADEREQLLQAGYVVVAIDYRLGPETKLPEILTDVEDAYRWIQEKGHTLFSADPQRVAIVGQSAGAYLALMAGVRASISQSNHFILWIRRHRRRMVQSPKPLFLKQTPCDQGRGVSSGFQSGTFTKPGRPAPGLLCVLSSERTLAAGNRWV
jgi:hypothetical protein